MAKPYRLSPLAEADLEEIWLYTAKSWSMEQADSYHRGLVAAIEGLTAGTKSGRPADVLHGFSEVPLQLTWFIFWTMQTVLRSSASCTKGRTLSGTFS